MISPWCSMKWYSSTRLNSCHGWSCAQNSKEVTYDGLVPIDVLAGRVEEVAACDRLADARTWSLPARSRAQQ
jgi:hypothetical protein